MLLTGAIFLCAVASVHDGDSPRCQDGTRVRLYAIDAPELKGCKGKRGRVCTPGDGQASRQSLARLASGRTLQCVKTGVSYNRIVARCLIGRVDLSCAQVKAGMAVERYGRLRECKR